MKVDSSGLLHSLLLAGKVVGIIFLGWIALTVVVGPAIILLVKP